MATVDTELTLAQRQAAGLRALAGMIESNPDLAPHFTYALTEGMKWCVSTREALAQFARAGAPYGAVTKSVADEGFYDLPISLADGAVVVTPWVTRRVACERIVIGTREVTEEIPDPDALAAVPKVSVTRTVEDVEWQCSSLLAAASTVDGAR